MAKVGVVFHHVPQHRPRANRHHGLGNILRIAPKPHSRAAAKQNYFHGRTLCPVLIRLSPLPFDVAVHEPLHHYDLAGDSSN